ncbi:pleckstrin homology domain-containing family G member 4B-like isoform X2 [Dendrobates tinctorius]|uniref:pleckstrin homology domain-containing family G member 4B-like isoform X2 n=1 Tax=Dendrobates tinctorius TaxID=92724 RepID=UPI003CCA11A8
MRGRGRERAATLTAEDGSEDSESLDSCIQKTLSSLYHPFESTAATLLCQVLDVVEKTYHGDGLGYLIDFLIPAKRLLQGLQQEACLQYCGLLFRHAGWPLCIHDKIVLQLASIDWRLLQPGDFYLQVVPYLKKTPRIVVKCLAEDHRNVEEVLLPEGSYTSIFTLEWLEFINSDRIGVSLENVLLTCDGQLHRVSWDRIVHPEFVEKKPSIEEVSDLSETFLYEGKRGPAHPPVEELMVQDEEAVLDPPSASCDPGAAVTLDAKPDCSGEIEGEYVELRDITVPRFGPQKGSLTQSIALNFKNQHKPHQRAKDSPALRIASSSGCAERLVHSLAQAPDAETNMGASVTYHVSSHVQNPETIDLVDIDSTIPDHTRFSTDHGMNSFQQTFNLENKLLSPLSEDAGSSVIKETDDDRKRPSPEPDNYSTSSSIQEESRSRFIHVTEDVRGATDGPVTEHSRTHDRPGIEDGEHPNRELSKTFVYHPNEQDCDQTVLQLPDGGDPPQGRKGNVTGPEYGVKIMCVGNVEGVENQDKVMCVEGVDNQDKVMCVEGVDNQDKVMCVEGVDNKDKVMCVGNVEGAENGNKVMGAENQEKVESSENMGSIEGAVSIDKVMGPGNTGRGKDAENGEKEEGAENLTRIEGTENIDTVASAEIRDNVEGADNAFDAVGAENTGTVRSVDNTGTVRSVDNTGTVRSVNNTGTVRSVDNTGKVRSVDNTGKVRSVDNTGKVRSVDNTGKVRSVDNTGKVVGVDNTGKVRSVDNTGKVVGVDNTGKVRGVDNTGKVVGVDNTGKVRSVDNTGKVVGVDNTGKVVGVDNTGKVVGVDNTGKVVGVDNTDHVSSLSRQVLQPHQVPEVRERAQSGECNDQNVQVAADVGRSFAFAGDDHLNSADILLVNGHTDELPATAVEQTKLELPYCQVGHDSPPRSPQYAQRAQSPPTQLPLETLHEVTEEEQGAATDEPPPVLGGDVRHQGATERGRCADQERTPEIRAERDPAPVWPHNLNSPIVCRKSESRTRPWRVQDIDADVLMSGVGYLPGTRDRSGRALMIINTRNTCWLNPRCTAAELGRLLLYFHSTVRKDGRALGLTLLVDARRCSPVPALFKAIHIVQAAIPHCVHGVLLLVEKDLVLSSERPPGVQFDVLTSVKSLHKHVEASQLPPAFSGTFPYCHQDWLTFRTKLEKLQDGCCDACAFLHTAIQSMHGGSLPDKAEEASLQLTRFDHLMKAVLEDARLVTLQTEGGAVLARLRKEESCVALTEDYREAMDLAAELYDRVDEGVHRLVRLSNQHIQELELVFESAAFEERFQEVGGWIENVGERLLEDCSVLEDSLEVLLQTQRRFREFDGVAREYCSRGQDLLRPMQRWQSLSSPDAQRYVLRVQRCQEKVDAFSRRLEESRERLQKTLTLYQFFDKAYEWALEGMRHLAAISLDDCNSPEFCLGALGSLEKYQVQHPVIGEKKFEEMRELVYELKSEKGVKHWKFAWSKCQEARQVFEKKFEAALRAKSLLSGDQNSPKSKSSEDGDQRGHSDKNMNLSYIQIKPLNSPICVRERRLGRVLCPRPEMDLTPFRVSPPGSSASSIASSSLYRGRKLSLQSSPGEDLHFDLIHQVPSGSSTPTSSRPMGRRLLRKAQSFDLPGTDVSSHGCQRRLSEPTRRGNTGVFIRGLEVSSTEMVERSCSPRLPLSMDWSAERILNDRRSSVSSADGRCRSSKLRHIIDEMVTTEREYVRSLWYISENYFPEMDRMDLPQDLRGKRGIIFGNLEKLRDFHSQYFLKELESCCNHPLRVSHCFLRHKDQFGMYALYSKNKPRSDMLLASHGNIFFKNKQRQLGDKMDLASYLLKPIQRMSKYALLLKDLIKECGEAQDQELAYLRAAEEMVKFQLRHGNDLLAMDAIRDCDVNLKEQGQLVRQDEFTVWLGRKKCQRHVFLFEDLILFSKPKRIEGGLDVYIYKRSFKTADIGLTENSGDSGLRFEIWFRRRKSNDTHILQAGTAEIKHAWTADIAKILWQQANRNKEIRMQEMVSMGVGNKPFLDIKPSDAAINNRAIDYIMKGRGARTRASIAVSVFDHSDPYKRTQAPITCNAVPSPCGLSSASLLGPLNLHMYVNQTLLPGVLSPNRPYEASSFLEEDELENETSCSQPSMTTESSESSHCMSGAGSSGSDSGCVSGIPQDNLSEDAGSPCDASTQYTFPERRNSTSVASPVVEKSRFINRQYISANPSHISLSPSTIV